MEGINKRKYHIHQIRQTPIQIVPILYSYCNKMVKKHKF
jgi:hypothetical protein